MQVRLVLASASPRRAELLTAAGFSFETLPVDVAERARPSETATRYVGRLAAEKSARALEILLAPSSGQSDAAQRVNASDAHLPRSRLVVIGADTAVVIDDEILGKPADDAHVREMLRRLSGRAHQVVTGVSVRTEAQEATSVEMTRVWFARLTDEEIDWYVASGECRDKAGAYAIQGRAARFIPRIEGSYSNVVGLPITALCALLGQIGG